MKLAGILGIVKFALAAIASVVKPKKGPPVEKL